MRKLLVFSAKACRSCLGRAAQPWAPERRMGRCVSGGNDSLATGMWGNPKLCTTLAGIQL